MTVYDPPRLLDELTERDFQEWKRHPVSEAFLKFMADKARNYREIAMDAWEVGQLDSEISKEARVRYLFCNELKDLKLSDIRAFYFEEGISKR